MLVREGAGEVRNNGEDYGVNGIFICAGEK